MFTRCQSLSRDMYNYALHYEGGEFILVKLISQKNTFEMFTNCSYHSNVHVQQRQGIRSLRPTY